MSKLFHVLASSARQISRHDRATALKGTLLITISAVFLSLVLTSIAILVVGERDWLSALVLATLLPLLLLPPPLWTDRTISCNSSPGKITSPACSTALTCSACWKENWR